MSHVHYFSQLLIFLLLSFENNSYILDASPLSYIFGNIFSQSEVYLCISLTVSFEEQKIFNFEGGELVILLFCNHIFHVTKIFLKLQEMLWIFRPMVHSELILVSSIRYGTKFIFYIQISYCSRRAY